MDDGKVRGSTLRIVAMALVGALILAGGAFGLLSQIPPRYRAQTQVALLPSPRVPPERIADYWEALSRGQAGRIAAEVLAQRRWQGPAAQAAGVPASSLEIESGVVADTSLINVGVIAGSPAAAEAAVTAVVQEATPVVEQVSGPFTLQVVQAADGSATYVGAPATQVYAVAAGAGLLIGGGLGLALTRRRRSRTVVAMVPVAIELTDAEAASEGVGRPVSAAVPAPAPHGRPQTDDDERTGRVAAQRHVPVGRGPANGNPARPAAPGLRPQQPADLPPGGPRREPSVLGPLPPRPERSGGGHAQQPNGAGQGPVNSGVNGGPQSPATNGATAGDGASHGTNGATNGFPGPRPTSR